MTEMTPINTRQLATRKVGERLSKPQTFLPLADFKLDPGESLTLHRDAVDSDRMRVCCQVGPEGLSPTRKYETIEAIRLDARRAERHLKTREIEGFVPEGATKSYLPTRAELTLAQQYLDRDRKLAKTGELDPGATIFGTDDRFLFNDRAFPWRTTGQIRTAGGRCTGTTIGPRLVLTASHCVNWADDGSSAGWITFTPGAFDGSAPWGEIAATQIIYWNPALGLLSDQETAFDYVVLVMEEEIGNVVGYPGYRTYDDDWNDGSYWQIIGYPGELAGGDRPAFQGDAVISSVQSHSLSGNTGFVIGHFNDITPGQSGGPLWGWWDGEPWPRVVGVVSTIGSTAVQAPHGSTNGDNEFGGGPALSALISWARDNYPA